MPKGKARWVRSGHGRLRARVGVGPGHQRRAVQRDILGMDPGQGHPRQDGDCPATRHDLATRHPERQTGVAVRVIGVITARPEVFSVASTDAVQSVSVTGPPAQIAPVRSPSGPTAADRLQPAVWRFVGWRRCQYHRPRRRPADRRLRWHPTRRGRRHPPAQPDLANRRLSPRHGPKTPHRTPKPSKPISLPRPTPPVVVCRGRFGP